jgi:proline iminopeptidase
MPQYQSLAEGQRLSRASVPGQPPRWFTVVKVEPNRTLVLRSSYGLFSGRQFDPLADRTPWAWVDGVWGFHLRRTAEGRTRLVVRNPGRSGPRAVARLFALLIGEPTHFAMQTRQFHNLRKRLAAET